MKTVFENFPFSFLYIVHGRAQVVGWPPIRQSRKNSLATTSKNGNEVDAKSGSDLFVKVSMDGAPYLRKIDLSTYRAYQELSSGLEKMFNCIIIGELYLIFSDIDFIATFSPRFSTQSPCLVILNIYIGDHSAKGMFARYFCCPI